MDFEAVLGICSLVIGFILSCISLITFVFVKPTKKREERAKLEAKREWEAEQRAKKIDEENASKIRHQELENSIENIVKKYTDPILEQVNKLEEGDQLQKDALMSILKDRLHQLFRFCNDRGYTGEYERLNFDKMFKNYTRLGGNGEMHDINQKFMSLPVTIPSKKINEN